MPTLQYGEVCGRKNPYDDTLTGLEDLAWAKWAMEQGYDIAYVAEVRSSMFIMRTLRGVFNRYRREAMAFRRIYPESHFSVYDFLRLTTMNILSDLRHAAREGVLWKTIASIFWFRFMQFHGTRMGYRESGLLTPQLRETFYYRARESQMMMVRGMSSQFGIMNEMKIAALISCVTKADACG